MRFSVECAFPHLGKRRAASRKSALWPDRLMQRRTLRSPGRAECAFPSRCGAREVWGNPPPGCGALWRMPQLGKCARATPRQAAGRVVPGSADLGSESGLTERRTLPNRRASECAFPSRRDRRMRLSVRVRSRRKLWCMGGGRRRPSPILECRSDQETTERKRRWSAPIG